MKERFMRHVEKTYSCWLWRGSSMKSGYGRFFVGGENKLAHRVAAYLFLGFDLSSPLYVCHHCDNKKCVNPKHFFIGTASDNKRDAVVKGLHPNTSGMKNGRAIISKKDSERIQKLLLSGVSVKVLAKKFKVSVGPIYTIKQRKHWSQRCV